MSNLNKFSLNSHSRSNSASSLESLLYSDEEYEEFLLSLDEPRNSANPPVVLDQEEDVTEEIQNDDLFAMSVFDDVASLSTLPFYDADLSEVFEDRAEPLPDHDALLAEYENLDGRLREVFLSYSEVFGYVNRIEAEVTSIISTINDFEHTDDYYSLDTVNFYIDAAVNHLPGLWDSVRVEETELNNPPQSDSDSDFDFPPGILNDEIEEGIGSYHSDSDSDLDFPPPRILNDEIEEGIGTRRAVGYVYHGQYTPLDVAFNVIRGAADENSDDDSSGSSVQLLYADEFQQMLLDSSDGTPSELDSDDDEIFDVQGDDFLQFWDDDSDIEVIPDLDPEEDEAAGGIWQRRVVQPAHSTDSLNTSTRPYSVFYPWWHIDMAIIEHVRRNTPEAQNARNHRLELDLLDNTGDTASEDGYLTASEDFE